MMTHLLSQETFEELLTAKDPHPLVVVYFTAKWCNPCKQVPLYQIVNNYPNIKWYVCDVDDNDYTHGYCGVKLIPAWLALVNGKPKPLFQSSIGENVREWLSKLE